MITCDRFIQKLNAINNALDEEIARAKQGACNKPIQQLETIKTELIKMHDNKIFIPSFQRFIVDSWDYTDSLGNELMELYGLYNKLLNMK